MDWEIESGQKKISGRDIKWKIISSELKKIKDTFNSRRGIEWSLKWNDLLLQNKIRLVFKRAKRNRHKIYTNSSYN